MEETQAFDNNRYIPKIETCPCGKGIIVGNGMCEVCYNILQEVEYGEYGDITRIT